MESKYKVGDIVTIKKKREGSKDDYRYCFTDNMIEEHGGKSYKIKRVSFDGGTHRCAVPDDGYLYFLEGASSFMWSSSMFEESSEALSLETSIDNSLDAFIAKKKCPKLDFTL